MDDQSCEGLTRSHAARWQLSYLRDTAVPAGVSSAERNSITTGELRML